MTPKEILKEIVIRLFNGVDVDDLSKEEQRVVSTLKKKGVVKIVKEYTTSFPSESDEVYEFVYPNWEYFDEGESPAVEEPERDALQF